MSFLNDNTLDNGLAALKAAASHVYINSSEPATYTAASSTLMLGTMNFGAGAVFPGAIAAASPNGRKLTTAAVTAGTVNTSGTATHWSIVSAGSTRLELASALAASQAVTSGNTWSLPAFDAIRLPNV